MDDDRQNRFAARLLRFRAARQPVALPLPRLCRQKCDRHRRRSRQVLRS